MSFIELSGIDDVHEKKMVPEGRYDLVIAANPQPKKNEKSGKINLMIVLAIEGHPEAANILHNLTLPMAEDEAEARSFKHLQIKRFCNMFRIDVSGGINTETFAGSRASGAMVKQDEYEGVVRNVIVVPMLPQES